MSVPWRVRAEQLRNGGGTAWSIYRLACADGPDERRNREYWPRTDRPAWSAGEDDARHLASVLNELDKLLGGGGEERGAEGE